MKVCAISDLHGNLPDIDTQDAELLFICGDIFPLKIQSNKTACYYWFVNTFIHWCNSLKVNRIYFIGGNHDFFLENNDGINTMLMNYPNIRYILNENVIYTDKNGKDWKIFGSPDTHILYEWAFMYAPEIEFEDFNKMDKDCDIMLTHDAAYGQNDICNIITNDHLGNKELTKVLENKHPKYHFTGHLHTSDHNLVNYNGSNTACVSLLNEAYDLVYDPLIINI